MRYLVQEKLLHIGEDNDILDENGQPTLRVDGKALSLRDLMIVQDLGGTEVARVNRKLVSLMPCYEIAFAQGGNAEVQKHFSPLQQKWTISEGGQGELEMRGNFLAHDFTITRSGSLVATISKAWVSLTATYGVEVAPGENDLLVLCSVLALEAEQQREHRSR